jgi:hypothetical protein
MQTCRSSAHVGNQALQLRNPVRNSRNSLTPSPAHFFFRKWNVCWLTSFFRQTSTTVSPDSASALPTESPLRCDTSCHLPFRNSESVLKGRFQTGPPPGERNGLPHPAPRKLLDLPFPLPISAAEARGVSTFRRPGLRRAQAPRCWGTA